MPGQNGGSWNHQASRAAFQQQSQQGLMPNIFGEYQGLSNLNFQQQLQSQQQQHQQQQQLQAQQQHMQSQQQYMSSGMNNIPNMNAYSGGGSSAGGLNHLNIGGMIEAHKSKVRVKCENCGVLLEVNVPPQQTSPTMVVRCGSCSSLLEVQLKPQAMSQPNLQMNHGGQQLQIPQMLPNGGNSFDLSSMGLPGQMNRMPFQLQQREQQQSVGSYNRNPMYNSTSSSLNPYMMQNSNFQSLGNFGNMQAFDSLQQYGMKSPNDYQTSARRSQEAAQAVNKGGRSQKPLGGRKGKRKGEEGVRRQPSLYNKFVSKEVERLKVEQPGLNNKEMFKKAASAWKYAPSNPKRVKLPPKETDVQPVPSEVQASMQNGTGVQDGDKEKEVEKYLSLAIECKEDSVQMSLICS